MTQIDLIGLGAGAQRRCCFASAASGWILGRLLSHLSPQAILIATLGWSHFASLVAGASVTAGLAGVPEFRFQAKL